MKQYLQVEQANGYCTYVYRDSVMDIVPPNKYSTGYIALWGGYRIQLSEETTFSHLLLFYLRCCFLKERLRMR